MNSVDSVIRAAEERLSSARLGLQILRQGPKHARSGLYNAVVFGRQVTFSLQNMRSVDLTFDSWYEPRMTESASAR